MSETGLEASASTCMMDVVMEADVEPRIKTIEFRIDHPFYVALMAQDMQTFQQKMIFVGYINSLN